MEISGHGDNREWIPSSWWSSPPTSCFLGNSIKESAPPWDLKWLMKKFGPGWSHEFLSYRHNY